MCLLLDLGEKKDMEWENLESQYLVDNEFLKVRQDKVKLPTGDIIDDFFDNQPSMLWTRDATLDGTCWKRMSGFADGEDDGNS